MSDSQLPIPELTNVRQSEEQNNSLIETEQNNSLIESEQPSAQSFVPQTDIIDPILELKNNNIVPLLAVIDRIDLNQDVDGKPLLSKLCAMNIPLHLYLKDRDIVFRRDADNRTALHEAIAADDPAAVKWCIDHSIDNTRDNFGNTPILEAIKFSRKACFLILLQNKYYDSQAPHACATYNRAWEIKVLFTLGYEVLTVRDSQHYSPMERAVENYGYDVAEFLTQINPDINTKQLAEKTDSKGIIRLIQNTKSKVGLFNRILKPLLNTAFHLCTVLFAINTFAFYQPHQQAFQTVLLALVLNYFLMVVFSICGRGAPQEGNINLNTAQYAALQQLCPLSMQFQDPNKQYCLYAGQALQRYHFHTFISVFKNNQVFWFALQVLWMVVLYWLNYIMSQSMSYHSLIINNFAQKWFFSFASRFERAYSQSWTLFLWFVYLQVFLVYQFCCCFELLSMMVLRRTYKEINNTHKYKRLYRIVRTDDGAYRSQEIRLMQKGLFVATIKGVVNVVTYFFT